MVRREQQDQWDQWVLLDREDPEVLQVTREASDHVVLVVIKV